MGDIYSEPNGGTAADTKASELFKLSYFQGPPNGSTISYSAWGQYGDTLGANRIYGLTAKDTNNAVGDFRGLTYYYDNSTFSVVARIVNNRQPPPYPPPPPFYDNTVTLELKLFDSTKNYFYISAGAIPAGPQSDNTQNLSIGTGNEPIIAIAYWEIKFTVNEPFPGGAVSVNVDINGSNYVNGGASANATTTFAWDDAGATSAPCGATGIYFDILIS